jgi:hypothetical protein
MIIETLEPVWNGSLEARGLAPGLSSYYGRSSLHHSVSWATVEAREADESGRAIAVSAEAPARPSWAPPKPAAAPLTKEREGAVALLLRKGVSYRKLVKDFGISLSQARRIAREIGMVRGQVAA